MNVNKILFASSEVYPLLKTGGLADVSGSLPIALKTLRHDVRIIMPAYREAMKNLTHVSTVSQVKVDGLSENINILETRLPGSSVKLWLVDSPQHFDRPGNPYINEQGLDWPDNAERFTVFSRAITAIALDQAGLLWQPEVVHCNDWQTGLVPALLSQTPQRPATVFTIHNLAYQGLFDQKTFLKLNLPSELWSMYAMEFHNKLSFIKGGLVFADMISTVSQNYAHEICTAEYGYGLEDLLKHRADSLVGILNGVNYTEWNPAKDTHLEQPYNVYTLGKKISNKISLQERYNLPINPDIPILGMVGRLVEQKGFDILLAALPDLLKQSLQIVILGSGESALESTIRQAMAEYPEQIAVHIGYDEALAHQIEGSVDMFLMPSRFEPCGLNQIYSLRYGTVPIVRHTGGLADTVIDATDDAIRNGTANGYVFKEATAKSLLEAVNRALVDYQQYPRLWKKIAYNGMQQDFSWRRSAKKYQTLYQQAYDKANKSELIEA